MFCSVKWLAVGFAVWMFATVNAKAAIGFQPVLPDELKITSEPLAPGAPAIILYRQVDRDDNGRTSHEDDYLRIKILNEEGRKHANVEIPFFKKTQDVVNIRARTIRPNGSIAEFDGKVYEKELVKGRGLRYLAKTFTLPDVQVGSIIECCFTMDLGENMLFESNWILNEELFTRKAQFSLKPYRGTYQQFSLRWSWNSLPPGSDPPKEGPDHIIRMAAANIVAFQKEDYMPPEDGLRSRVDFIYEEGIVERDQASYWKKIGKQRNAQLEGFIDKNKAMQQAVAQIAPDPRAEDKDAKKGIFPFALADLFDKALTLGTGQAPVKKYNEYLRDLIVNGRAKPSKIVSHHIAIEEAPGAYEKFDKRIDGYTKVLIKFGEQKQAA